MSAAEIVGLALTMGLIGGLIGSMVLGPLRARRWDADRGRARRLDAYAHWLACQLRLNRAAGSFVAAFRCLALEPPDAPYFELRLQEAQRVRAEWCAAVQALDHAEAELLLRAEQPETRARLARIERITVRTLRQAIEGSERQVEDLALQLRTTEEQVIGLVKEAAAQRRPSGPWSQLLARMADRFAQSTRGVKTSRSDSRSPATVQRRRKRA